MAPRLSEGLGLVAGFAAMAAGGIAVGLELERRIVAKRILRSSVDEVQDFFALRSPGVGSPRRTVSCCIPRPTRGRPTT